MPDNPDAMPSNPASDVQTHPAGLQPLEPRMLLSGDGLNLDAQGKLTVTGSAADDSLRLITVADKTLRIRFNGHAITFRQVNTVQIKLGRGLDSVRFDLGGEHGIRYESERGRVVDTTAGYKLSLNGAENLNLQGDGDDRLVALDSSGDDTLRFSAGTTRLLNDNFAVSASGFRTINTRFSGQAGDTATLLGDPEQSDRIVAGSTGTTLRSGDLRLRLNDIPRLVAQADSAADRITFLDAAREDVTRFREDLIDAASDQWRIIARDFNRVSADWYDDLLDELENELEDLFDNLF